jgi:hypothetical protein
MYWTARCKQDPWLQPEGANCRLIGAFIPDDLRQAVPDLQTLNFPKTENMIPPADRQHFYAQYMRLNSPVAMTKRIPGALGPTDDMFTITNPLWNAYVQQGQIVVKATQPKVGMTQLTELEFKWLDAPPTEQPYAYEAIATTLLLQGYLVPQSVTRGHEGRWEVRARISGRQVPGPWSFPVQFRLFLTKPTQSKKQSPPIQHSAPLPSSSVTQPSAIPHTAPLPSSSVMQAPAQQPIQQAPLPSPSVMQAPAPSSSAPTQMRRSPSMIMPRGVDEKPSPESHQTVDTSPKPEKKP